MVNQQSVSIRKGTDDDLEILSELGTRLFSEQNPSESIESDRSRKKIFNKMHSDGHAFIFEINDRIIGYSLVSQKNDPLNIEEFFIIPEERGKYYGNEAVVLLSEVTNWKSVKVESPVWRAMAGGM
ncbi:MAG: hypothetical protein WC375_09135 [Methanomassiliicoccales archaeon]|jgi:hypothetical protein